MSIEGVAQPMLDNGQPATTLTDPVYALIRAGVMDAYEDAYNVGKPVDPFLVESIVLGVSNKFNAFQASMRTVRDDAFDALDDEREYQDAGLGNADNTFGERLKPEGILTAMDVILTEAKAAWYKPHNTHKVCDLTRKIGGLAVQMLENYGVVKRQFLPWEREKIDNKLKGSNSARDTCAFTR